MANKFMFFENFKDTADRLPDDLRLKFYDAMTDYVFKGIEPDDAIVSALITAIKPSLDKEDHRGGVREGAGAKANNQNAKKQSVDETETIKNNQNNQKQSKQSILSETETETETENNTPLIPNGIIPPKGEKHTKRFVPPKVEDVMTYCREKNYSVDANRFVDFYSSKGWLVGKSPMKDWRAAVRTWERDAKPVKEQTQNNGLSWL